MTEEKDGADVVELFPSSERTDHVAPLRSRPRDPDETWCLHKRFEMHGEARRVYCQECGREVPAFDALDTIRAEWEHFVTARRIAKRQASDANRRLAELERQEKNLKARIRRMRSRLPPGLDVQEIDWLVRFLEHHEAPRLLQDRLLPRLAAMRNEIEPPA